MVDDLRPGPYLQFWEITAADGTITRLVDFAEPQAATPGDVTYRTYAYTPAKIGPPQLEESIDGASPSATVEIQDPARTVLAWVRAHANILDAKVRMDVIRYEDIADATKATVRHFRVREVYSAEGPPRVGVTFGSPGLTNARYPRTFFVRPGCFNDWARRFNADGLSLCTYPTDEFEAQTGQEMMWLDESSVPSGEVDRKFGWKCLYPDLVDSWDWPNTDANGDHMLISSTDNGLQWSGVDRAGPYQYKILPSGAGTDEDFDVYTKTLINSGAPMLFGLLVQDADSQTNWLFWGHEWNGTTAYALMRSTASSVSTDQRIANTNRAHRLVRSGSTWTGYTGSIGLTDESEPVWTQRFQATLSMSGDVRVGIVIARESSSVVQINGKAYYMRFKAGGYTACDRSLASCTTRDNLVQRNGFLGLPDAQASF